MNPADYDDYRLMELAISLYYEGYSREMLIKKLMEKVNDPVKQSVFTMLLKNVCVLTGIWKTSVKLSLIVKL